jgi:hypothetical protein
LGSVRCLGPRFKGLALFTSNSEGRSCIPHAYNHTLSAPHCQVICETVD